MNRILPILGVTGGSGSGKTAVCRILEEKGGFIINADQIAHMVISPGQPAYDMLVSFFGGEILGPDKAIFRGKLGEIIFTDIKKKTFLERTTHPYILKEMREQTRRCRENPGDRLFIVYDAPLLVESGLHTETRQVWLIQAAEENRLNRITNRDRITKEHALARLSSQTDPAKLRAYASLVINNDSTEKKLYEMVIEGLKCFFTEAFPE